MTPDRLHGLLTALRGARVAVVGDLMLDEYVWGDVSRISPDAPVQVVDVRRRSAAIGGAANVAHNLKAAGGDVALFGAVGSDASAKTFRGLLGAAGLGDDGVLSLEDRPTTVKARVMARGQQIVRLDTEERRPIPGPARAAVLDALVGAASGCGAVLVSDYAKGVIDPLFVAELASRLRAAGVRVPILVDPKLVDLSAYRGCDVITPNRKEAEAATGLSLADDHAIAEAAARIRAATGAAHVLITLGERGMALSGPDGTDAIPAQAHEVFDVTGAGDTVLAYLGLALAAGAAIGDAARLSNLAAGVAVGKLGTSAVTPVEIATAAAGELGVAAKAASLAEAVSRVEHERSLGRRIVFTNGCFDLLHAGHVHLLERARALGDFLVVGVNSDASVRRLKGPERPVVDENDRVKVLSALDAVGLVVVFEEDTPLDVIRRLRPDVLAKGGDYTVSSIVGAPDVLAWGGRVETIPLVRGRSTSGLVDVIRKSKGD